MTLAWSAREAAHELSVALNSVADLINHRPDQAVDIRRTVIEHLDPPAHTLLADLLDQLPDTRTENNP